MKTDEQACEEKIAAVRAHPLCFDFRVYRDRYVLIFPMGYSVDACRGRFSDAPKIRLLTEMLERMETLSKEKVTQDALEEIKP